SIEVEQIIQQRMHSSAALDQARRGFRYLLPGVQCPQIRGGHLNRLKRGSQIVPEDAQKKVASLVDLLAEEANGLGNRLVDGFIEADDIIKIRICRAMGV